jgi:hypothetical protein
VEGGYYWALTKHVRCPSICMNVRQILLLFTLAAIACRTSPQWDRPSRIQCTPELEGKFVGGGSGLRVGVPLRGSLFLRFKDGSRKPASVATIVLAEEPCPHNRPQELDLTSDGKFETTFNLPTDTHWFCSSGKVVEKQAVGSLDLTLLVPGCDKIDLTFSEDSKPFQLETRCQVAAADDYKPEQFTLSPALVGAHVELRGADLYIEGTKVPLPIPVTTLESVLGKPSEVVPASGDAYSNDVYQWEGRGVFGYSRAGEGSIHAIGLQLHGESNEWHWCDPGTVQLLVNGLQIDSHSSPSILKKAGFVEDGYAWRQRNGGTYATVIDYGEPRAHSSVEVGVR